MAVEVVNSSGEVSPFEPARIVGSLVIGGIDPATTIARANTVRTLIAASGVERVSTDDIRFILDEIGNNLEPANIELIGARLRGPRLEISAPGVIGLGIFANWAPDGPRQCKANRIEKKLVYSRGNNEYSELQRQKAKTGKAIYETGRFFLDFVVDPAGCVCGEGGKCTGKIDIILRMKITMKEVYPFMPDDYTLLCGPDPSAATTPIAGGMPPSPDLSTTIDVVDLPAAKPENTFKQPDPTVEDYLADAACEVPCMAGKYLKRFYIAPNFALGRKGLKPGTREGLADLPADVAYLPVTFIDCEVDITESAECELSIAFKAYLLEFVQNFSFGKDLEGTPPGPDIPGAADELPELEHQETGGVNKGKTRNIAKLINEDGVDVDTPFEPSAP